MAKPDKNKPADKNPEPEATVALETRGETAIEEFDYGEDAGKGRETIDASMLKIPFLGFFQPGTPGLYDPENPDPKIDPLRRPGNILEPVTKRVFKGKEGILGVAVAVKREFTQWKSRDAGGGAGKGFVARHDPDSGFVELCRQFAKKNSLPFGRLKAPGAEGAPLNMLDDVQENMVAICAFVAPDGSFFPAVFAVKSTGIPPFQAWITSVNNNGTLPNGKSVSPSSIPLAANQFRCTSQFKDDGKYKWYIPTLDPAQGDVSKSVLPKTHPLVKYAIQIYDLFAKGEARIDDTTREAAGPASGGSYDQDIPFATADISVEPCGVAAVLRRSV